MMLWKTVLTISFLLLQFSLLNAQEYLFDVQGLNVKDGLPDRRVFNVVQDKTGYIWLSSPGAISRYDGTNFKTYANDILVSKKNFVPFLAVDKHNNLWLFEGLKWKEKGRTVILAPDRKQTIAVETFTKGLFTAEDIFNIQQSAINPDVLFFTTRKGIIYKYDGQFEAIFHFDKAEYTFDMSVYELSPGGFYYVLNKEEVYKIKDKQIVQRYAIDRTALSLAERNKEYILGRLMTSGNRLVAVGKHVDSFDRFYWELKDGMLIPFTLVGDLMRSEADIYEIQDNYLLYSKGRKLIVQSISGDTLYQKEFIKSFLNVNTRIIKDKQNILWLPSENGLYKVIARKKNFKVLSPGNSVRGIIQYGNELWVGGYSGDVSIDLETGSTEKLNNRYREIHSFSKDHEGHIWACMGGEHLREYDPSSGQWVDYPVSTYNNILFENKVNHKFWLGTSSGLYRFYKEEKKVEPCLWSEELELSKIRHFHQSEKGIWVAGEKGLSHIDPETDTLVKHYTKADGLPDDNLNFIHEDKDGIFWLGSAGAGLIRWDMEHNNFQQFTRETGLSNNNIYAIYEDEYKNLWLPSNYGLMRFDKNTNNVRTYLPENGIAHEEFNTQANFQAEDGTLFFGGLNGITQFHPDSMKIGVQNAMALALTKIQILEKGESVFSDKMEAFQKSESISLNPGDQILEIEVSLLNYENTAVNHYAYKIVGHQENWIYTHDNKISLINLPYGKYNIIIKAKGDSGTWSEKMLDIPVHVKTPFYLQWKFRGLVALLTAGLIFLIFKWRVNQLEKDKKQLEEEVRKRTKTISEQAEELKQLDKSKTRFFSNITHEFRTPLTLIIGPLEQFLAKNPDSMIQQGLSGVLRNAQHLLILINQLLDLSKLEGGKMEMELAHGDIASYTQDLVMQFIPLAKQKQLNLDFVTNTKSWEIHFDSDKWNKIIYNLLSNAIKFTPEGGSIKVKLNKIQQGGEDKVQLIVADTGIGIEQEALDQIFNRFYQVNASSTRTQDGTGIGLSLVKELVELQKGQIVVNSEVGIGTQLEITLPVLQWEIQESKILELDTPELISPVAVIVQDSDVKGSEVEEATDQESEKLDLLIIEDNKEMQAYIRSCLDEQQYHIHTADNGEEGIDKARAIVPDLIISDIMMPVKDGFEVTATIRNDLATSHIPLILLSAKASLESRLKGLDRGADAYLTKPFSPEELILRIRKLIAFRKHLQQRYQGQELPDKEPVYEKEDVFIIELRKYIVENIQSELSVQQVSKHFAISRAQLYRKLKALTGKSLTDFVRTTRLGIAMQLIEAKQLNLSEIAYETGFSSLSHFSRTFKKSFGKPPSEI